MNVRDTVKGMLFTFPTLYKNPVDTLVHMFTNYNEWDENGELDVRGTEYRDTMKMEIDGHRESDLEWLRSLNTGYKLNDKAVLLQRQFIADNIDDILFAPLTNVYFGDAPRGHYFTKGISNYASAFDFPDNITKDWGDTLYKFLEYWLYQLNLEYGVDNEKIQTLHWWPKDVLKSRDMILDARKRLHPLLNKGESYETHEKYVYDLIMDGLNDKD